MRDLIRNHSKLMVILVAITMILPMLVINTPDIQARTQSKPSSDDIRIASEISNTTGIEVEEILELKSFGKTWNEILDMLKNNKNNRNEEDKKRRNNVLITSSVGEDYVEDLKEEGHSEEEIIEVKLLVERVIFQLNEITRADILSTKLPNKELKINEDKDISDYIKILNKLELKSAVYWTLKLKEDFNSIERSLDEYLYALQFDMDIEEYFINKEEYQKEMGEKRISIGHHNIITLVKIEEKMLDKLQNNNMENRDFMENENIIEVKIPNAEDESSLPIMPKPVIDDVKPLNPNEEIMKEIESINPNDN